MNNTVFLSYVQKDLRIAELIINKLMKEDLKIWFDVNELKSGDNIFQTLEDKISASDYIVILISSESIKSLYQKVEIHSIFKNLKSRNITVIPVLIDDCQIPEELKSLAFIDIRKDMDKGINQLVDRISTIPEIDFEELNYKEFESLVFDLLVCLGFKNITSNTKIANTIEVDLVATYERKDPFRGLVSEKWLFELKLYHNSRPNLRSLNNLAEYLKIEMNTRVVLITNSQLTSVASDWINSSKYKDFIYVVDGTELRRLLVMNNELIKKYFRRG